MSSEPNRVSRIFCYDYSLSPAEVGQHVKEMVNLCECAGYHIEHIDCSNPVLLDKAGVPIVVDGQPVYNKLGNKVMYVFREIHDSRRQFFDRQCQVVMDTVHCDRKRS